MGVLLLLGVAAVWVCFELVLGAVGRGGVGRGGEGHPTALPVLISPRAGEQWHRAGGLLESQGMYPKQTDTHTHTHTCRSILLSEPVAAGPTRIKCIWVCHGCFHLFSFVFMMQKLNCDLGKREKAR